MKTIGQIIEAVANQIEKGDPVAVCDVLDKEFFAVLEANLSEMTRDRAKFEADIRTLIVCAYMAGKEVQNAKMQEFTEQQSEAIKLLSKIFSKK